MVLIKREVVDKIEILPESGIIQVRTASIVEDDGQEIARAFHRRLIEPGEGTAEADPTIKALIKQFHTKAKVAEREAMIRASLERRPS